MESFHIGQRVTLSQRGLNKQKYCFYTRWGFEIFGRVVSVTEKNDCMKVLVDGEKWANIWHKTYWNSTSDEEEEIINKSTNQIRNSVTKEAKHDDNAQSAKEIK